MSDLAQRLVVARVGETREVVAVAQWVLKEEEAVPTSEVSGFDYVYKNAAGMKPIAPLEETKKNA